MTYAPMSRFATGLSTLLAAFALLAASCAGGGSTSGTGGSGGSATGGSGPGTGGSNSGTGGSVGTGGSSTGGTTGTGGSVSTGGVTGTGGTGTGGGSGGSGGSAGKGGSTGTGGGAGKAGTGGAAGAGATTFFTDDFESDTAGKQPAGFDNLINYNYKTTNPQTDGSGSAVVDSMHAHNGSKLAVHFSAQGGSLMVLLERPLPTGTNHLYLRVFVFLMNAMGDLPAQPAPPGSPDNHETLLGLTANPANADSQIRFGQIKGAIGTNWVPSDDIAPIGADWYMGAVISAGSWHCIEVEFAGNAPYNSLYAYSDGALIHSITSGADWAHNPEPANWMNGLFTDVVLGWQSFSSLKNDVWMDDLAMSSTGRIGCN